MLSPTMRRSMSSSTRTPATGHAGGPCFSRWAAWSTSRGRSGSTSRHGGLASRCVSSPQRRSCTPGRRRTRRLLSRCGRASSLSRTRRAGARRPTPPMPAGNQHQHETRWSVVLYRPGLSRSSASRVFGLLQTFTAPASDRGPALALAVVGDPAVGHRRRVQCVLGLGLPERAGRDPAAQGPGAERSAGAPGAAPSGLRRASPRAVGRPTWRAAVYAARRRRPRLACGAVASGARVVVGAGVGT